MRNLIDIKYWVKLEGAAHPIESFYVYKNRNLNHINNGAWTDGGIGPDNHVPYYALFQTEEEAEEARCMSIGKYKERNYRQFSLRIRARIFLKCAH